MTKQERKTILNTLVNKGFYSRETALDILSCIIDDIDYIKYKASI